MGLRPIPEYNLSMHWGKPILGTMLWAAAAFSSDAPPGLPLVPCPEGTSSVSPCTPSKAELKEAKAAFAKGLKFQHSQRLTEAFDQFEAAARLAPQDVEYVTAREMARQQLVFDHLQQGNAALLGGREVEALGEFRAALNLDPQNDFAQQRLSDALGEWAPRIQSPPQVLADAGEVHVVPDAVRADFHYRGDSRGLLTQVASAFGVTAVLDDSVVSRQLNFDVDQLDFYSAMRVACALTHTFWSPLAAKQILLAAESTENHKQFDRMALRTFYVPGASTPQDLNDLANVLRSLFDIRFLQLGAQNGTIIVRAPQNVLDAATSFMQNLDDGRPQVMLDVRLYEISHTLTRNMGVHIPNSFTMFNLPAGALALLGGQNIQQLINQLIASGGINQANSQALSGLLAQLTGQQSSIFSQPFGTFGGGLTLMGVTLGNASAQLSLNESSVKTLEHATLRVAQGNEGSLHVGARYPILNASFAPIFNTPAIASAIQNSSFRAPVPSFSYEDIGLSVKAKPVVHSNSDVGLQLELQFRTLLGQSLNGVPVIGNREYKGSITLKDSEPAVVAGAVSRTEQRSLTGIPGMGDVPGLNHVMASNSNEVDDDELLIVITPRIIREPDHSARTEIWLPH